MLHAKHLIAFSVVVCYFHSFFWLFLWPLLYYTLCLYYYWIESKREKDCLCVHLCVCVRACIWGKVCGLYTHMSKKIYFYKSCTAVSLSTISLLWFCFYQNILRILKHISSVLEFHVRPVSILDVGRIQ